MSKEIEGQPWDLVVPHLLKAGVEIEATLPRIQRFCALVLQWNRVASNLISKSDERRIVARHVVESVAPAYWLKEQGPARWIDFGSGGGFPALPLALCGIGEEWLLVESRRSKSLFLRRAIQELGLDHLAVANERLEDMDPASTGGPFDGFTSRATLPLVPSLVLAAPFVRAGGRAFLWKGSRREEEMASDPSWNVGWELDGLLGVGDNRTVVCRFLRNSR